MPGWAETGVLKVIALEDSYSEKTRRTRIRCRTFLLALLIAACALVAGTYINARYTSFTVSLDRANSETPNQERGGI